MVEEPEEFYSRNPEEYDSKYGKLEDVTDRISEIHQIFSSKIEGDRILDAGCGTGRDTEHFAQRGLNPIGIDIATGAIEYAQEHKQGEYRVMDMKDLDFKDNSFDGIWCAASIFFMPKQKILEAIKEFDRVLKQEGILHISFKIGEGSRVKEKRGGKVREYLVTETEARDMLQNSGFRIEHTSNTENSEGTEFQNFIASRNKLHS